AGGVEDQQVLGRLRLRAGFVGRYKENDSVEDACRRYHRGHQRLVARSVHYRYLADQLRLPALGNALLLGGIEFLRLLVLIEVGVRIAEPYRYPPLYLLAVRVGPFARQRLRERGLAMVDMAEHADVHLSLHHFFSVFSLLGKSCSRGVGPAFFTFV